MDTKKMCIFNHCCQKMIENIADAHCMLRYEPIQREYYINDKKGLAINIIQYCPWCAQKLPSSLEDQYFFILETEYGINDPFDKQQKNTSLKNLKVICGGKKENYKVVLLCINIIKMDH